MKRLQLFVPTSIAGIVLIAVCIAFIPYLPKHLHSGDLTPRHLSPAEQNPVQVVTSQYDNARTGANLNEAILTPQNVNASQFGKLFTFQVDGDVYAQPLYVPQLTIPGKGVHDVVFVATEHDSVYAFDAEGSPDSPLWTVSLLRPGESTLSASDVNCSFISPEVGVTSTPVIDPATGTLYVLARSKTNTAGSDPIYVQRLHALDITTGTEKFGGPVEIQAIVPGTGDGSSGGQIRFNSLVQNPRASLLLANGKVYLTWASSCDVGAYHGWVMAYDAATLAQEAVLNVTPNSTLGGIWQGDTGPAADSQGNLFLATGNGGFDAKSGGSDYGDSVIKLGPSARLSITDYFTPANQLRLEDEDLDLGSSGVAMLPDLPGPHPHELVVTGKGRVIYVIDRDDMGKFHSKNDNRAIQSIQMNHQGFGAPAYWNNHVYIALDGDNLKAFKVKPNGKLSRNPVSQSPASFNYPGCTPAISANGDVNGIVWAIENTGTESAAVLHAYDATDLSRELYNSQQNSSQDQAGNGLRFTIPTVAAGRVYVGASGEVDVYGPLASTR